MKKVSAFWVSIFLATTVFLQPVYAAMDYTLWTQVLQTYVNTEGRVDYRRLKENRRDLDVFVDILARTDITTLSPIEQKAFWINAYNALTIQTIIDRYPVKSIRKIWRVWDTPKNVARAKITLGKIEENLRALKDPRVHFALNCASLGCPLLPREPFDPEKLDEQLDREAQRFILNPQKVRLDRSQKILYVSSLLTWYQKDFKTNDSNLMKFILRYLPSEDLEFVNQNSYIPIKDISYDWNLNEQN